MKAVRYHDFCAGHRVVGHESKCAHLHGHNYRVHFAIEAMADELDSVGRVIDFSVIKDTLCEWLEANWDHKFLAWEEDTVIELLSIAAKEYDITGCWEEERKTFTDSFVIVPFNPTAENMATHLLHVVGPALLDDLGVQLTSVRIEETRKCSVEANL